MESRLPAEMVALLRTARPLVLLTETVAVAADAAPIFVAVIADAVARQRHRMLWICAAQTQHHYAAIARKNGMNLREAVDRGDVILLDALTGESRVEMESTGGDGDERVRPMPPLDAADAPARWLDEVRRLAAATAATAATADAAAGTAPQPVSVALDDAGVLLTCGWSPAAVLAFLEACEAVVSATGGMLVVRIPADDELAAEPVGRVAVALAYRASLRLQLRPLASGYSRDLDGELAVIPWYGPATSVHVKVTELGLRFSARGLAHGVV